jgi:signal transduction histidine kinase
MREMWGRLRALLRPTSPDFRDQLIAAAALVGIPVGWASAAINAVLGAPTWTVVLNAASGFAVLGLWLYARATGRYRLAYRLSVGALFLVLFPALFFAGGGYESGMPVFFMFAIAFSALILDGLALRILVPLEAAVFTASIWVAYLMPETVTRPTSELSEVIDIAYAVLATGLALVVALRLFIGIYEASKQQVVERNAELAQVDQTKTEFLALVAHELNTPLTVIRAHAEEAAHSIEGSFPTATQVASDLMVIGSETDRLARLVSQLLDLARINDGRLELTRKPENLDAIIQQTLQAYRPVWARQGNSLLVPRGGAAPIVLVDAERVVQVLVNLLSNAARHTTDGTISVAVQVVGAEAEVSVTDSGEGIPEALLVHLGERPLRGLPGGLRSAKDAGLGVGLMISKHIVEAHGGRFVVESQVGRGTTVRFTLPLADAATPL